MCDLFHNSILGKYFLSTNVPKIFQICVYKDGKEVGMIEGLDFKKALFGIWLGAKPADKGLKNEMLGND